MDAIHTPKTLGPKAATLVAELHERDKAIFSNSDVERIIGLAPKSARGLARRLVDRGVATRLKPGLFILVPFELGHEREYLGNPYVIAREIAGGSNYYISHASAMDIHQMVTQPQLIIYSTAPRQIRPITMSGAEFRFARCKPEHLFGVANHWVTKTQSVRVSDIERTIIDGLKQSEYCGGFSEVAKGAHMRENAINPRVLVDYALRLNLGAVIRRLGYLLELLGFDAPGEIERLRTKLTQTYAKLDPMALAEGRFLSRWRLRLNVSPEEIEEVVRN